jgi:hypothetical protein
MQSPKKTIPTVQFHEDDQTAMCPYEYRGKVHDRGWTGAKAIFTGHYLAGKWEEGCGCVDLYPPTEWVWPAEEKAHGDAPTSERYRRSNTANSWVGEALAARLMHAEKVWDHDAFFAYVDRWMTEDDTPFVEAMWKVGIKNCQGVKLGEFSRQQYVMQAAFVREMWEKYRNNLPPGPDGHKTPPAEETWK